MNFLKIFLSSVLISAATVVGASPVVVESTPGGLKAIVGEQAATATSLAVTGDVNASDLQFVNFEMPSLTSLDLSGATIVAYSGDKLLNGRSVTVGNTVPDYAFINSRLTEIVLPSTVISIGEGAFSASAVTSIVIPQGVTSIGKAAFADCKDLRTVVLPAGLTSLGAGAFRNCTGVTRAELGSELTVIPERAFAGCSNLATIFFPTSLREIGNMAFYGVDITNLTLDKCSALTSIGDWAFADCPKLTNIYLPSSDVGLGTGAFFSDPSLTADVSKIIGNSDSIPSYAFTGNASMDVVKFENTNIKTIGDYAMRGLSNVDTITMPATLERLGTQSMAGWAAMTSIDVRELGENVPELGDEVWQGVAQSDVNLVVYSDQAKLFRDAPQWKEFAMTIVDPTAIDEIIAEQGPSKVKGYFTGSLLTLESSGAEIVGFQLYDLQGRMVAVPQAAPAQTITVNADAVAPGVAVVRVLLADNTVAVLKLAR